MMYKTFRGKWVDMDDLRQRHEKTVAAGNMDVNARGDKLGPGGKIEETVQKRTRRHYSNTSTATKTNVSIKGEQETAEDVFVEEKVAPKAKAKAKKKPKAKKTVERETNSGDIIIDEVDNED